MFNRSSSHRNNPALRGSQLWSMYLPRQRTPKCIATLQSTLISGCSSASQWFSSWDGGASFQGLSRFTQGHSRHTETRRLCYSPLEPSRNLQVTCRAKGHPGILLWHPLPGEETACGVRTWVRKEKQQGMFCHWFCHALLACQVCVTFGFSPGW